MEERTQLSWARCFLSAVDAYWKPWKQFFLKQWLLSLAETEQITTTTNDKKLLSFSSSLFIMSFFFHFKMTYNRNLCPIVSSLIKKEKSSLASYFVCFLHFNSLSLRDGPLYFWGGGAGQLPKKNSCIA